MLRPPEFAGGITFPDQILKDQTYPPEYNLIKTTLICSHASIMALGAKYTPGPAVCGCICVLISQALKRVLISSLELIWLNVGYPLDQFGYWKSTQVMY